MNIYTAAHYLKSGYRVRRAAWETDSYLTVNCVSTLENVDRVESSTLKEVDGVRQWVKHSYMLGGWLHLDLEDILADDWEIVTSGIRKHFGRYGMEYNDDTDWDNYVPTKGGWDYEDE